MAERREEKARFFLRVRGGVARDPGPLSDRARMAHVLAASLSRARLAEAAAARQARAAVEREDLALWVACLPTGAGSGRARLMVARGLREAARIL